MSTSKFSLHWIVWISVLFSSEIHLERSIIHILSSVYLCSLLSSFSTSSLSNGWFTWWTVADVPSREEQMRVGWGCLGSFPHLHSRIRSLHEKGRVDNCIFPDFFWPQHHRWRNLSLYVKDLVDEEQRRHQCFSSIFVMTDDLSVMNSLREYSNPSSKGKDESYAREHLKGREILFSVFVPQAYFNPVLRIGFEQFLVQYSQFTLSHTDSNVGRYLMQIVYAKRQFHHCIPFESLIVNAPDSRWNLQSNTNFVQYCYVLRNEASSSMVRINTILLFKIEETKRVDDERSSFFYFSEISGIRDNFIQSLTDGNKWYYIGVNKRQGLQQRFNFDPSQPFEDWRDFYRPIKSWAAQLEFTTEIITN